MQYVPHTLKVPKFGAMQDVHILRWKIAARVGASARGKVSEATLSHFPSDAGKKGEVPGQAVTGNIAIGASVDTAYSDGHQKNLSPAIMFLLIKHN